MTSIDKGKYSVIIFENLHKYFRLNRWNRDLLDKYCREYSVGIIGFIVNSESIDNHRSSNEHRQYQVKQIKRLPNLPLSIEYDYKLKDYQLNPNSNVFRIARPGSISLGIVPEKNWSVGYLPDNIWSIYQI